MTPYFSDANRTQLLMASARTWEGTPFARSGGIKGAGVCCHRLAVGVLHDAGFPITQEEIPNGTMNRATHHPGSVMADWLRTQPERFEEIPASSPLQPGDVLLIKLGVGVNHAAIALPDSMVVQCWQKVGTNITAMPQALRERVAYIFRPIAQ